MVCNARMNEALHLAIKHCGGPSRIASQMGVSVQRLNNWIARGVPVEHCPGIERVTDGQVHRWDLRPDDWFRIWPELVGVHGAPEIKEVV